MNSQPTDWESTSTNEEDVMQQDLAKRARQWADEAASRGDLATAIRFRALASAIEELTHHTIISGRGVGS